MENDKNSNKPIISHEFQINSELKLETMHTWQVASRGFARAGYNTKRGSTCGSAPCGMLVPVSSQNSHTADPSHFRRERNPWQKQVTRWHHSVSGKFRAPGVPVCLPARRVPTPGDFPERTQKKPALAQNNPPAERAGREASSRGGYKIARCYVTRWRFQRKPRTALGQVDELPTVQWRCVP